MCEIFTFPATTWNSNKKLLLQEIATSILDNPHGLSVCTPTLTLQMVQGGNEKMATYISRCLRLLNNICVDQRIWIHTRYATTSSQGVAECHGFSDINSEYSTRYMHNGMLYGNNYIGMLRVDSFELSQYAANARSTDDTLCGRLMEAGETFANVFAIDEDHWSLIRMGSGTLYRTLATGDHSVCYSSHPIDAIGCNVAVVQYSQATYSLDEV